LRLEEHGPEIVFIKGVHNTDADQSHSLGMTPVSIEQLRSILHQKSIRSQNQSETKLNRSLKNTMVQTKSSHQQT
jgi:hypothetical protein